MRPASDAVWSGIWRDWADDVRGGGIDSGHYLPEEAPEETWSELRSFFIE